MDSLEWERDGFWFCLMPETGETELFIPGAAWVRAHREYCIKRVEHTRPQNVTIWTTFRKLSRPAAAASFESAFVIQNDASTDSDGEETRTIVWWEVPIVTLSFPAHLSNCVSGDIETWLFKHVSAHTDIFDSIDVEVPETMDDKTVDSIETNVVAFISESSFRIAKNGDLDIESAPVTAAYRCTERVDHFGDEARSILSWRWRLAFRVWSGQTQGILTLEAGQTGSSSSHGDNARKSRLELKGAWLMLPATEPAVASPIPGARLSAT